MKNSDNKKNIEFIVKCANPAYHQQSPKMSLDYSVSPKCTIIPVKRPPFFYPSST